MRTLVLSLLLLLTACGGSALIPVPGTTTRVEAPERRSETDLEMKIFTNRQECAGTVKPEDVSLCLPHVDRRSGQVRLAVQLRLDGDDYPYPLTEDSLRATHMGTVVADGPGMSLDVIPHDPVDVDQLYILVIDGSGSMADTDGRKTSRMERVRAALLEEAVQDAFFPRGGSKTGVVLLSFTSGDPVVLGGSLKPVTDRRGFTKIVRQDLQVRGGYTHLYNAVRYATGPLLEEREIKDFIDLNQAAPTVIVLTDGFNNIAATDTCADNAPRLQMLMEHLETARRDAADIRMRPSVFTVGLGKPLRPRFERPDTKEAALAAVSPAGLCGKRYRDQRIDGDLETRGIDNASLELIADRGGGQAYVRRDREGLAEAFRAAAAQRYTWFEVRYQVDPHHLRRSFESRLRLFPSGEADTSIRVHPSAWLDAPPGSRAADGRVVSQPYHHTATVLMPALGLLISLSFIGAAGFNTSRILFRRSRKKAAPKKGGNASGP